MEAIEPGQPQHIAIHDTIIMLNALLPAVDDAIDFLWRRADASPSLSFKKMNGIIRSEIEKFRTSIALLVTDISTKTENVQRSPKLDRSILSIGELSEEISRISRLRDAFLPALLLPAVRDISTQLLLMRSDGVPMNRERYKSTIALCGNLELIIVTFHLAHAQLGAARLLATLRPGSLPFRDSAGRRRQCNLIAVLDRVANSLQPAADQRQIGLLPRYDASAIVESDPILLERCLSNVLDNAIKYTYPVPDGSPHDAYWIDIKTYSTRSGYITISISNFGAPVTPEEYSDQLMFDNGYRGYYAQALQVPGSGAGLADVKRFVEDHGGSVTFGTEPVKKGNRRPQPVETIVTIELPAIRLMLGGI